RQIVCICRQNMIRSVSVTFSAPNSLFNLRSVVAVTVTSSILIGVIPRPINEAATASTDEESSSPFTACPWAERPEKRNCVISYLPGLGEFLHRQSLQDFRLPPVRKHVTLRQ